MCWAMAPVGFLSVVAKEILCGLAEGLDARGDGEERCYMCRGVKPQQPKSFQNFLHISYLPLLFPGILHHFISSLSYIDR